MCRWSPWNEAIKALASSRRESRAGQVQRGHPSLGAQGQALHVVGCQLQPHRAVQQLGRLLVGEVQVGDPDLGQLSPGSHPGQRQRWVSPSRQHYVDAGREVVQEDAEGLVAAGVGHQVVVVQHQHQRRADRAQLAVQRRQHRPVQVRPGALQGSKRGRAHARLDGPQRLHDVSPEASRVVVALVQRHPGHPAGALHGAPLGRSVACRIRAEPRAAQLALQAL